MTTLVNNLKGYREGKKYQLKQVAQILGIPANTYANYEKGSRPTPATILAQLAGLYNVSIDSLILCNEDDTGNA